MTIKRYIFALMMTVMTITATAQRFFNLTAKEVRIDSVMPEFVCSFPLGTDYEDSTYTVEIKYPEFLDMSPSDTLAYFKLSASHPGKMPVIDQFVTVQQQKGILVVRFVPIVYRSGKYQYLVSFMLNVTARSIYTGSRKARLAKAQMRKATSKSDIYTKTSVLSSGTWAKIRVPSSGVYQLTQSLINEAGFTDLSKVKIYGYGGNLQNETLVRSELKATDDLKEVPTCTVGGKRLFYAKGPVSWSSNTATIRTRNNYSDYGYYFITQDDTSEPASVDSTAFLGSFYPSADDYHTLYEVDDYSWFEGGRRLVESTPIKVGTTKSFCIEVPEGNSSAVIRTVVTSDKDSQYTIKVKDQTATLPIKLVDTEDVAGESVSLYTIVDPDPVDTITITSVSGGTLRLDYISATFHNPYKAPDLNGSFPAPEYVYRITEQNLHADSAYQMVIIYPASAKLKEQAERLAAYHTTNDGMNVRVVPADEIFNEFSSGTPDANAYRRYMKMLYDRAGNDSKAAPRYLVLFGDGSYDNRMNTPAWKSQSPDDYLLCYESEESFNNTESYVNEGFFTALDDGDGGSPKKDLLDVAVGRIPVTTAAEAKIIVDKSIRYMNKEEFGPWLNTCMFMGDDGNDNLHMKDAEACAEEVESLDSSVYVRRVMEDAYTLVKSSTGGTYPEATSTIKKQMESGALLFNYSGHGGANQLADEKLLMLADFQKFTNKNLPLWFTASCNTMPFDRAGNCLGEAAMLNDKGGTVAFVGTTRTVYADKNRNLDLYYLDALFTKDSLGNNYTVGEALRLAKNAIVLHEAIAPGHLHPVDNTVNKLNYALLGDPALALHMPSTKAVVDSINGISVGSKLDIKLSAGTTARVSGHIERNKVKDTDFNGVVNVIVRDTKESITCLINQPSVTSEAFTYTDRTKVLFNGNDSVRNGDFSFSFAVPMDINYADESGYINLCAISKSKELSNGSTSAFDVGGTGAASTDSIGPSVYCYLNSPSFRDGGDVNQTPYFHADITDKSGINTSGSGIGHDLQLIIDGDKNMTYNLNDNFTFENGSYTTGSTYYTVDELSEGMHTLKFRAWDILNNPTTTELSFRVVASLAPDLFSVDVTKNPARESTTFILTHNYTGSNVDVEIEIFDMSGRLLHKITESGVSTTSSYTVDWDLTTSSGGMLQTGVYLYRAGISSNGSKKTSKAKKLIIINN